MTHLADAVLTLVYLRKVTRCREGTKIILNTLHECLAAGDEATIIALMTRADLTKLSINALTTLVRSIPAFIRQNDNESFLIWEEFARNVWLEIEKTRDPAPLFIGMQFVMKR